MGTAVSILPARSVGAVASGSQMVSAQAPAPAVGPVAHPSVAGEGDERLDSMRTTTTAGAGQVCTVMFRHTSIGISEGLFAVLFFEHSGCDPMEDYLVLGNTPFGDAEEGVDYRVSPDTVRLDDSDGTDAWSFNALEDEIPESGEGAFVFITAESSGVTFVGPDTARININDNDDPSNTVPNNPQSLSGDPGDRRVTLSWTPPSNTGGSAIRRYEYRYAVATASYPESWRTVSGGANARSVTVSNLNNGTTYKFEVRAVNGVGPGTAAETTATPTAGGGGTPSLRINDVSVGEAAGTVQLTVTLSASSSQEVRVDWATVNGTADSGSDYTAQSGTLIFSPNTTTQRMSVPITDDSVDEPPQTFTVVLNNPVNATIADGSGQVSIIDNDGGGTPSLSISNATVAEGAGTATLRVTLLNGGTGTVTVSWATEAGTATVGQDFTAAAGSLSFAAGEVAKDISVSIIDDSADESNENFTVKLRNAQGATIADSTGQITITDNDGGTTTNRPSAPRNLAADPGNAQVTLSWTEPASNGGAAITSYEYRYAAGTNAFLDIWITVPGGATQVTVGQLSNGTTYRFQVRAVNEAGGGSAATTTAIPVDPTADPSVAVADLTVGEGDGTAVVRVTLAPQTNQTVTVDYATSDGSATEGDDYTEASGTLTFAANESAQEIRVTIINDGDDEEDETFTVTLTNASGAEIGRAIGQVTIQDNDGEGTTVVNTPSEPQNLVAEEGDGEVTLSWSPPTSNGGSEIVRYEYRYAEGSDPLPEDWTTVSGGPGASQVSITGLENGEPHRFHVRAVNEAGGGNVAQEAATPQDTGPPPSLSIDDVELGEGSGTAILRVTLSEEIDEEVTVGYATSDGSATAGEDYTSATGTLTFDAGTTAREISVSIADDSDEESNETITVTLSNAQGAGIGDGSGRVTILDNDGTSTTVNPPGAPRSLEAVGGNARVTLSWTVPASDGGAPVTRYEYRYTTGTSAFPDSWTRVPGEADTREVTFEELDNGTRYRFQVRAVNSAGEGEPAEARATPFDPADGPSLTIDDETVDEDGGNVVLRVTLLPSSDDVVTVRYETSDGSATAGRDYSAASGLLRFNPGDSSEEIRIPIINDNEDEAREYFYVRLRGVENASIGVGTAEVTIRDDDSTEGAGRPGPPRDFIGVGQHRRVTLTWLPPEDDGGAPIAHYEYRFVEGSNRFPSVWTPVDGGARVRRLRLSSLTNGVTYRFQLRAVNGGARGIAVLTEATPVHPDSTPSLEIRDADVGEGDEEATLTVLLSPPSSGTVTVSYATSDGTATAGEDYTETSGTLTFSAGASLRTITVPVLEDEDEEGDETFSVTLSLTGNADAKIDQGTGLVTIRDNDGERALTPPGPPAGLFGVGGDSLVTLYWSPPVSDGGAAITHYEYRYAKVGRSFRVRWTGIVGEGRARRLIINGLENGTPYRFQVRAVNQVGPGELAETRATPGEEGTRPGVTVEPLELELEEGDSAEYTVVLDAEPFANVTVRMTANLADTDLEVEPIELVFRPTDWDEPQTVLVKSAVDEDVEDDLGIVLTHEARGGGYDGFEVPSVTVDIVERRERTLPTVGAASGRGTEGTRAELIFYVALSSPSNSVVTLKYETVDGTATAGEDYEETSGTLAFVPGTVANGISVPLVNDVVQEGEETFRLELFDPQNATFEGGVERLVVTGTIVDDDVTAQVSFGEATYEVNEGGTVSVTVELSRDPGGEVRIPIALAPGEGLESDEFSVAELVTFAQGQTSADIEFSASDDHVNEDDEVVVLTLGPTLPEGFSAGDPSMTEITIRDDDPLGVRLSPEALEFNEGDSATYAMELTSEPPGDVTVRMTADLSATNLVVEPLEVVFTPSDWSVPRTITVRSSVDIDQEDDLGIALTHEASGAGYDRVLVPTVTVDIIDLRLPVIRGEDAAAEEASGGSISFVVRLSAASNTVGSVEYATVDGTAVAGQDYAARAGTLHLPPGQTVFLLSVPLLDDFRVEGTETFRLELFNPQNATFEGGVERLVVTGTIVDDDVTVQVSFGEATYEVNEGGTVSVTVELSRDPGGEVRIPIALAPGEGLESDEFSVAELVTFAQGQTSADIEFSASDDHVNEDDEVVVLTLGPTLPEGFSAGDPSMTEITIRDDDPLGVRLSPEALEFNEGDSATYAMELTSEPPGDVTVRMTADLSATNLVVEPLEVVFTPSDWSVPRTITVRSSVDIDQEDDLGIALTHEASGAGYDRVLVPTVTVDIIDLRLPVIRGEDAAAEEASGGSISFVVRLSAASNTVGSVEYATVDGTAVAGQDYAARAGTLHLPPGQTVFLLSVPLLDDFRVEGTETFRLELFNPVNALLADAADRLVLTGSIEDNDELVVATFGAASYEVPEGGTVTVAVELSGDPGRTIQVPIMVTEGAGADRGDFAVARNVTFNRGERTVDLLFRSTGDEVDEDDELVTLELAPTLPEGVVAGDPVVTDVTIVDDDQRGVNVSVEGLEVEEGTSSTYSVQLTSQPTGTVRIAVDGNPAGSDLTVNPASLSFTSRNWRAQQTFTVAAAQDRDAIDEPVITLSHQVSGADYADVAASGVTVTILEDDTPVLSMADVQATEGDGEMVFEALLNIQSSREIRVNYVSVAGTATEGEDYVGQAGTLVLAPLQTTARIVVPLVNDEVDEAAEHFTLDFADFTNAAPPGDLLSVTGTILDDDLPVLSISAVDQTVPEGTDARFRLARVGDLSVTLSVPVTVRESGDFLAGTLPEAVDFEAGAAEAILALPTEDDPLDESDGTVEVTMASNDEYEIPGSPTARLIVADNDQTPAVIIAGAEVAENAGEITLPVTLRGASAYDVSVDWMTTDLTARAGDDYGAASGRITFAPGETTGEVRVTVMDDLLPEDPEEFAVTLSGPVNAVLEVGAATVTITDDDEAVAQAWLSRFGRTVASQVVEGIGGRFAEGGGGSSALNTGGVRGALAGEGRKTGLGDLLDGSTFRFSQGAGGQAQANSGGGWTAWGRGMRAGFEGAGQGLSVDGSVLTALAGVDYESGAFLAGIAASHSLGDGTLTTTASGTMRERSEEVESSLTSVYPYLRVNVVDRVSVWGLGGYGRGNMSFPAAASTDGTGIEMRMGALGARAALLGPEGSGFSVALKSDAFLVRMSTDADAGTSSVDADASRMRLLLEAANRTPMGASGVFAPMIEVGVRRDGGDAETGTGVEVGGGFRYANEAMGLSIEGSARMLVSHQDTAFSEWGAGGTLVFQPGGRERGLSVRMGTSWGAAAGGAEDLWSPYASGNIGARGRRGAGSGHGPGGRLTAQLHYAMSPFGDGLSMAPYAEIGLAGDERGTSSRVGWRFDVMESLRLSIETNVAPAKSAEEGRGLVLRGRLLR